MWAPRFGLRAWPWPWLCLWLFLSSWLFLNTATVVRADAVRLHRAVNINGPALVVDGLAWQSGQDAQDFKVLKGTPFENQTIAVKPTASRERAQMLRSCLWGPEVETLFTKLPNGPVKVVVYVWEDNNPEQFAILLNGREVAKGLSTGQDGSWKAHGPYDANIANGELRLTLKGPVPEQGGANLSGIEIWSGLEPDSTRPPALEEKSTIDWAKAKEWWAFQPITTPPLPTVKDTAWPRGPIDHFLLAGIESAGLSPAPDASRATLLRRVTYDLIGLPPTPEEVTGFTSDSSPQAWEKVIDRLLASPHYGERWGRHWLDTVRYADTAGDNSDFPIPQMHLYRDWVIRALNEDLPYDAFVKHQLAGDLMEGGTVAEQTQRTIATGYLANSRRFGSRVEDYPWHLTYEDQIDNIGQAFLGLTINCARCHDHKFDPISAKDYYALYGIFQSTQYPWPGIELEQRQRDLVPLVAKDQRPLATEKLRQHTELARELMEKQKEAKTQRDAAGANEKPAREAALREAELAVKAHHAYPPSFSVAYAVNEAKEVRDAEIQKKGDPAKLGEIVPRGFLTVLGGQKVPAEQKNSGRLNLAEWLLAKENPLAARVMVNRLWQGHFGTGLVPTPNDFGRQGKPCTHPQLLDYLASRFRELKWSMKAMHREIMLSHAYQQSSVGSKLAEEKDATNTLLSYFPRRRLDAESLRDTLLKLGGSLQINPPVGPHPFPPEAEWEFTQHNPFKAVYETPHRSVYLMTQRIQRHPFLAVFDGADPSASTPQRAVTTSPVQALFLLNDPLVHQQSERLAENLLQSHAEPAAQLRRAWELLFSRPPTEEELAEVLAYLAKVQTKLPEPQASLASALRALLRLNEFTYLD